MERSYKILSTIVIVLFTTMPGFSQNMLQKEGNRELREIASAAADRWTNELALSAKQTALMEDKLIEFALKKNEVIQSKLREEVKTEKLRALQLLQYKDMRDILTKPQFETYLATIKKREAREKENQDQ